jgi:hypothetical protein
MDKTYYVPVSSSVFPELASAEAVSSTAGDIAGVFTGRRSYPTKTTGDIPVNPVDDLLIVYSEPVTWKYRESSVMDYPLVIKLPEAFLDASLLVKLEIPSLPQGISAWAYSRTVFLQNDGSARFLFRTEEEMSQQIHYLSPFQEVKDLALVKDSCESFEGARIQPAELPDGIADEIRSEVSRLGLSPVGIERDLKTECRTGACLGYAIGHYISNVRSPESAGSIIKRIRDKCSSEEATRILDDIRAMQRKLVQIAMDSCDIDYAPCEIMLKPFFRHIGRAFADDWAHLDHILRRCVDFIAAYSPAKWNWYGNDERSDFMRNLWNDVLKDDLDHEKAKEIIIDAMRQEIANVCRHFKSPNAMGIGVKGIHSPLIQSLYIVLECNGDANILDRMSKNARRPDYCLALYGAFKGYSYFPRTLIPERLVRTSANVPREDIPHAVSYEGDGCREEPSYVECCSETELPHNFEVAEDSQRGYAVQQDLFVLPQKEDCVQGRKAAPTKNRKGMTAPDGTYKLIPAEEINKLLANGWIMGKRK